MTLSFVWKAGDLSEPVWEPGIGVSRRIVKPLAAREAAGSSIVILPPDTRIQSCQIVFNRTPGGDPYAVEFEASGKRYTCPLFLFQPRTEAIVEQPLESAVPALELASAR